MAVNKDKIDGKWYCSGCVIVHGEKIWYKRRGFDNKWQAINAEKETRKELENKKEYTTLNKLVEDYKEYSKTRLKDSSLTKNKYVFDMWCERFGECPLNEFDKYKIQPYIDELDVKYSKKYVAKIFYVFNACMRYGVKNDYLDYNPLDKVERSKRPNEAPKEMKFWEPDDFNKFISVIDDEMYKTFFMILFFMGIRRGECIALQWKDIDFNANTITISKTSGQRDRLKNPPYTTPKTKNSYRTITMPDILSKQLQSYKRSVSDFYGFSEQSFVFGIDLPMPAENIRRAFHKYIHKANHELKLESEMNNTEYRPIEEIRIHDLRHSHASYLINNMSAGFTDFDIAKRLGDTVETLHETYAHWFKRKDENIINFMNMDFAQNKTAFN